jgi:monooxygenase
MSAQPTAIIVGSGITGLGAAYYLGRRGIPYIVLEAKEDVGGVWFSQRWHGARCDSDIVKYSFSFRPVLSDRALVEQPEIHAYLRSVAEEFGIRQHIRFGTAVTRAAFDTREKLWRVETTQGTFTAQFLFNGNGYFSDRPHVPEFPGTADFAGEIVHTHHLDRVRKFPGKNVVVVGSGSTAICCAPALADVSQSVVMLQRSPSYIFETDNAVGWFARLCQSLYRRGVALPLTVLRGGLQMKDDLIFVGFRRWPAIGRWFFRQHWLAAVGPDLVRAHFTPRYNPWAQRIPVAIGLQEKVRSGRVRMVTGEIARFTRTGLELKDGTTVPCDVCVLATGFDLNFLKFEITVDGAPVSIERANFYKGVMLGGIPNYFQPVGVWHSAWTHRSESVTKFALKVMDHMAARGLGMVTVPRRTVPTFPSITPNYITRHPEIPRLYGSYELPSLDKLLSYRFAVGDFAFA